MPSSSIYTHRHRDTHPDLAGRQCVHFSDWHVVCASAATSSRPASDTFDFGTLTRINWSNTPTHTHTHVAFPLWNWMGLVKTSLPNACWSLSVSLSILWINKRRADTLHRAQSQLPRSANQSSLPSLPSDCCNDHGRGGCCNPTIGAHVGDQSDLHVLQIFRLNLSFWNNIDFATELRKRPTTATKVGFLPPCMVSVVGVYWDVLYLCEDLRSEWCRDFSNNRRLLFWCSFTPQPLQLAADSDPHCQNSFFPPLHLSLWGSRFFQSNSKGWNLD